MLLSRSFFSTANLDTESLSELAKKSGQLTSAMADFFIGLIQDLVPNSMFIHLDYTMQSEKKRLEHVASLGIDANCVGWTIVLMNRGPKAINDSLIGYHWVVGIISPEGQVFYGDPLNSVEVPKNFQDMVNPYYKARFGTDIPDVFNCSNAEMFPNFPKQLSDAHICGFVGLLVMLLASSLEIKWTQMV